MRHLTDTEIARTNGWTDPEDHQLRRVTLKVPPPKLNPAALYGPLGEYVRLWAPFTEASPANILFHLLAMFGNLIGPNPYRMAGGVKHHCNLTVLIVGLSSRGRKGTGSNVALRLAELVDAEWARTRIAGGTTSGEGIVWHIRDRIEEVVDEAGTTKVKDYGVTDKRLLLLESEFTQLLRRMNSDKSVISPVVRKAWDCAPQHVLRTGGNAYSASFALITIIGHIVRRELERYLLNTIEAEGGFGNRALFVHTERSQLLDDADAEPPGEAIEAIACRLRAAVSEARKRHRLSWDAEAKAEWEGPSGMYRRLERDRIGRVDDFTTRAPAQVMRLSMIYALLDQEGAIGLRHLNAAAAAWQYCEDTLHMIFGESTGSTHADRLLERLRTAGAKGMSRTALWEVIDRNKPLKDPLELLERYGLAYGKLDAPRGRGRRAERWYAVGYDIE